MLSLTSASKTLEAPIMLDRPAEKVAVRTPEILQIDIHNSDRRIVSYLVLLNKIINNGFDSADIVAKITGNKQ